jgi:tubulin polyglutamylase TTLL4
MLLDKDANVYILEANISPAMGTSSELDRVVKTPLNLDLFNMINLPMPGTKMSILDVPENTPAQEYLLLHQYEETLSKRGDFRPVFPTKERIDYYNMMTMTENDKVLSMYATLGESQRIKKLGELRKQYISYLESRDPK